jgi:hypothetical protein
MERQLVEKNQRIEDLENIHERDKKIVFELQEELEVRGFPSEIISEIHTCSCYGKRCNNEQCVFRGRCMTLQSWEAKKEHMNHGQAVGTERDASDGSTPSLTESMSAPRKCSGCGKIIEYPYFLCEECREKNHERQPWDKDGMG